MYSLKSLTKVPKYVLCFSARLYVFKIKQNKTKHCWGSLAQVSLKLWNIYVKTMMWLNHILQRLHTVEACAWWWQWFVGFHEILASKCLVSNIHITRISVSITWCHLLAWNKPKSIVWNIIVMHICIIMLIKSKNIVVNCFQVYIW